MLKAERISRPALRLPWQPREARLCACASARRDLRAVWSDDPLRLQM